MILTPKYVNPPKPGKRSWSIKTADNTLYFFEPDKVGMTPTAGQPLEVEVASDGKWRVITTMVAAGAAPQAQSNGAASAPWYMPFVSNTVAHAIEAKAITTPEAILEWAIAAKSAALELAMGDEEEEPKF